MTVDSYIKAQLAELGWKWASAAGHNTRVAVVLTVANRVRAGWNGGDWLAVLNEAEAIRPRVPHPDPRDPEFLALLAEVDTIYDGGQDVLTGGALWFAKSEFITADTKIERTAELGGFTFYK